MSIMSRSPQHRALGNAIRELRACQRLSQEQLGFRAGLHRNYIGAVERGELNPTYGVLLRLCAGLGIRLAELVALGDARAAGALRPRAPGHGRARLLPVWNGRLSPRERGRRSSC
jgi:transcriptional regulator with XRE-family HTH domain